MDPKKLIIINPKGMTATVSTDRLEYILLEICGGGLNNQQTADAMQLGHKVRDGELVEHAGWTLRIPHESAYTLHVSSKLLFLTTPGGEPECEVVGELSSRRKVLRLDERLHHLHSELEGCFAGSWFDLDEDFQFVGGPEMAVSP